jgi:uncharacterized protein YndB with AHSA1/START domain
METNLIARASITIDSPRVRVWNALVTPTDIRQYMFGTDVVSDWKVGSSIVWKGEWHGSRFEDRGVILQCDRERILRYSHFSPLSGLPDEPANHHTVTIELSGEGPRTRVSLSQDNNSSAEAREHSERNWATMLTALKEFLER